MATFPDSPSERGGRFGGTGLGTPGVVPPIVQPNPLQPKVANFFTPQPGGNQTLQALMLRQKELAARNTGEVPQIQSWTQGLAHALNQTMQGYEEGQNRREMERGNAVMSEVLGSADPTTGAFPADAAGKIASWNPELAYKMLSDRQAAANAEHWVDMPPPEGAKPGQIFQRNNVTGEVRTAGGQAVTQIGSGETEFEKEVGKKQAATYDALYVDGIQAAQDEISVGELEKILSTAGTGTGAGLKVWAKDKLGLTLGDDVTDLQAADAIIAKLVPSQRAAGSGTISDKDIALFRQSLPSIWNQPGGNAKILNTIRGLITYRKAQGEIASQVMTGAVSRQDGLKKLMSIPNPLVGAQEVEQPPEAPAPEVESETPAPTGLREGQTGTDEQGGKWVVQNGKWVPQPRVVQ